jgi:hypothetical protein
MFSLGLPFSPSSSGGRFVLGLLLLQIWRLSSVAAEAAIEMGVAVQPGEGEMALDPWMPLFWSLQLRRPKGE